MDALVSCLMPTLDRRPFVPLAIESFLRQDYPARELVILDDGKDPVGDLVPDDPRIVYQRLAHRVPLGTKRNLACQAARGQVLVHWDDDDVSADHRLGVQVQHLRSTGADVSGVRSLLFWEPTTGRAWRYRYPPSGRPWVAGSSMCFTRAFWERHHFPDVAAGEDTRWLWRGAAPRVACVDGDLLVAVLHGANTSRPRPGGSRWSAAREPEVLALLGPRAQRYRAAARGEASSVVPAPAEPPPPMVSCLMPTADRHGLALLAVEHFLAQDYPDAELVIVDDGAPGLAAGLPRDGRIRYHRLGSRSSIGAKRTAAATLARGQILAQWDDDDWYGPARLRRQVEPILAGRADVTAVTGCLFLDTATGRLVEVPPEVHRRLFFRDVVGGTLVYRRELLTRAAYPDTSLAEDAAFLRAALRSGARLEPVPNEDQFVYVRHGSNSWAFDRRHLDPARCTLVERPVIPAADVDRLLAECRRPTATGAPRTAATAGATGTTRTAGTAPDAGRDAGGRTGRSPATVVESPPVTACLLSWRRPENLRPIVRSLAALPFIDEILVWNNDASVDLELPGARVITSPTNLGCQARYRCAAQARHEIVYTQDDDALVGNVPELYRAFLSDPGRITHGLSAWHYPRREEAVHDDGHVAMLGWGSFFRREWLSVLDDLPAPVRASELFAREADKYFTIGLHRRHQTLRSDLRLLPGHSDPASALWKQPEHAELSALAVREALRLARERHRPHLPVRWHVVVTCHDLGRYLEECVRSVLLNEADCHVTVVDDASDDGSADVARDLAARYGGVDVVALDRNVGPAAAVNTGIATRDSVFVVRLDADDRIGPTYLRRADDILRSGADVANPDAVLFGLTTGRWSVPPVVDLPMLLERNRVHCAAAFRRGLWAQVGGFDEELHRWLDYDFWIRLAAAGARIRAVPGDHFFYRRHSASLSQQPTDVASLQARLRGKHADLYRSHAPRAVARV